MPSALRLPPHIRSRVDAAESRGHDLVSQGSAMFRCVQCDATAYCDEGDPFPDECSLDECADCGGSTAPGTPDPHVCSPALINLGDAWPWPRISDARRAGEATWFETTEERSMEALEAVPPRYFRGGFCMGEPAAHDERGVPIYAAFIKLAGRHFVREVAFDQIPAAVAELTATLNATNAK